MIPTSENGHLYSVCEAKTFTWSRHFWWFLENTTLLELCISWKPFKNVRQVVDFRLWNHYKTSHFWSPAVFPRDYSWFRRRKMSLSGKLHFQDCNMGNGQRNHIAVVRETTSPPGHFGKPSIRRGNSCTFRKSALRSILSLFSARQTVGIHAFLSSATWNSTANP